MYNTRVKNRKIKKIFSNFGSLLRFKTKNFSLSSRLALVGIILGFISLFMKWIKENTYIQTHAFNKITGFAAFIIFICLLLAIFIIFSTEKKEKLKMILNISFKDSEVLKKLGFIITLLSISSLYNISGLSTFSAQISYDKGIIFTFISGIIIFYSGYMSHKQELYSNRVYLQDSDDEYIAKRKENNMKLPF